MRPTSSHCQSYHSGPGAALTTGLCLGKLAAPMAVALEPLKETASERHPELEAADKHAVEEDGKDEKEPEDEEEPEEDGADEKEPEDEEEPEVVLQVTPQLASGGTTPTKFPPAVVNVRAGSKSPPGEVQETKVARGHSRQGRGVEAECGNR